MGLGLERFFERRSGVNVRVGVGVRVRDRVRVGVRVRVRICFLASIRGSSSG